MRGKVRLIGITLAMVVCCALIPSPGPNRAEEPKRLIIIDDDIGMLKKAVVKDGPYHMPWIPATDPDGGLEIIYALRDPNIEVVGITCTMGCSSTDVCVDAVEKILLMTGRTDVPVLRGASSPEEIGKPSDASDFIINTLKQYPGQVEIVATAPLTNIATALMQEPDLPQYWKELHVGTGEFMGALGEVSDGAAFRYAGYNDMNINVDPKSAAYVLEHGGRFIMYPNEIMDDAHLSLKDLRTLKGSDSELARYVGSEISLFTRFSATIGRLGGMEGLTLHGVIPLAIAIDPELADPPEPMYVGMEYREFGGHYFTIESEADTPERQVYMKLADPETVQERMMERLLE
jgi:purine nucleosidase